MVLKSSSSGWTYGECENRVNSCRSAPLNRHPEGWTLIGVQNFSTFGGWKCQIMMRNYSWQASFRSKKRLSTRNNSNLEEFWTKWFNWPGSSAICLSPMWQYERKVPGPHYGGNVRSCPATCRHSRSSSSDVVSQILPGHLWCGQILGSSGTISTKWAPICATNFKPLSSFWGEHSSKAPNLLWSCRMMRGGGTNSGSFEHNQHKFSTKLRHQIWPSFHLGG